MSDIDSDIQAAFANDKSAAPAQEHGIDPDIADAFAAKSAPEKTSPKIETRPEFNNAFDFVKGTGEGLYQQARSAGLAAVAGPSRAIAAAQDLPKHLGETWDKIKSVGNEAGKNVLQFVGDPERYYQEHVANVAQQPGGYEKLGKTYGPWLVAPAAELFPGLKALAEKTDIGKGLSQPAASGFGTGARSMGAAEATTLPGYESASPELKAAADDAIAKGGINAQAWERHAEADALPVKVRLTEGQATQDPNIISKEMNNRAHGGGAMADYFKKQNEDLKQNLQVIRDSAGEDVFSTDKAQHGDTLIQAYRDRDAPIKAQVDQAYADLRAANGGDLKIDGAKLAASTRKALKSASLRYELEESAPSIERTLQDLENGGSMNFEQFENFRTTLADKIRKANIAGDGSAAKALKIVRGAAEDLPLEGEVGKVKELADKARSLAKQRFASIEKDPAMEAALDGSVAPDAFVQRFVTGERATRDNIALMRENLKDNPRAVQTIGVSAMDQLRDASGVGVMGTGNFNQAGYNRAFSRIRHKAPQIFGPETAQQLESLGNVAGYTQFQPKGSYVNNSNTWVSAAGDLAGHFLNAKTGGALGMIDKLVIEPTLGARRVARTTRPGAGLDFVPAEPPSGTPTKP